MPELKILFVEDDPADVTMARYELERDGLKFDALCVCAEAEMRAALEDFAPDVVLCDYTIPGYSGRAALALSRQMRPSTPFLFVSGTIGDDQAIECLALGAADYLLKSNLRRLGPAVRSAVNNASERERTHHVEQSNQTLTDVLDSSTEMVFLSDPTGHITFINDAACRALDTPRQELLGQELQSTYLPRSRERMRREVMDEVTRTGSWKGNVTIAHAGNTVATNQVITAHKDESGEIQAFSTLAHDLRGNHALTARIRRLAHFDTLTGLPNLTLMDDVLRRAIFNSHGDGVVALALVNLDNFRFVNEGYGRKVANRVLKRVAASLVTAVGADNTVARVGRDEFLVILAGLSDADAATTRIQKVLDSIALPRSNGGKKFQITASAGIALYPMHGNDFECLSRDANAALHVAKARFRGSLHVHAGDTKTPARLQLMLKTGLSSAIERHELSLHYQPQFEIRTGRACGVEALARWFRAGGEIIPASTFIPLAEQTGLIGGLGAWVLQEACRTVAGWHGSWRVPPTLCVNVSPHQLLDDFPLLVEHVLETTGFPAGQLELEITESVLLEDAEAAIERLSHLKRLGVRIAVDDFGTGYSSLTYLSQLPVDRLKVDKSLIARMTCRRKDLAIVRAVISMGRDCGFTVIAEGVETEEQLALLRELGCEQAQGYLLAPATDAAAAIVLLETRWGARSKTTPAAGSVSAGEQHAS